MTSARYIRQERLGEGATAEVYRGLDRQTGASLQSTVLFHGRSLQGVPEELKMREMDVKVDRIRASSIVQNR